MDLIPHFGGILKGGPIEAEIMFCPPLTAEECADRKRATRAAEAAIRVHVGRSLRGRDAAA
jgi:hypothetical protein